MAGYAGTPLPKKLGIKEGHSVAFVRPPASFADAMGELPRGVVIRKRAGRPTDVIVAFFTRRAELEQRFSRLAEAIYPDGALWIAWPKRASKLDTDISEDVPREVGLAAGLVDNKVCAIDETWSGLRLVWRVENRGRRG